MLLDGPRRRKFLREPFESVRYSACRRRGVPFGLGRWPLRGRLEAEVSTRTPPTDDARALLEERDRLRLLVENTTDIVSTATNSGVITWISDSVTPVLGWQPGDIVGHQLSDYVHPDDMASLVDGLPALQRGDAPRAQIRVRERSGGYRWISLLRRQIFDDAGNPSYRVGGWRDVTEERNAQDALAESHAFLRALLDAMLEPFVLLTAVHGPNGHIVDFEFADANPAALAVYGRARAQLLGCTLSDLHPAAFRTGLFEMYCDVVDRDTPMVLDDWSYPQDIFNGALLRYDVRAVRVGDAVLQVWRDVTSRFEAAQALERLAHHDGLTGALNHSEALRRLGAALDDARNPGEHLAVLFCDTDNFKYINDHHGHSTGDQVLVELTRRIGEAVRRQDLVARMGGDEFLVVLTGVHDIAEVAQIAEKVRLAAHLPMHVGDRTLRTSLSIGVTLAKPSEDLDRLLERADIAMYEAKRAGRNRVVNR